MTTTKPSAGDSVRAQCTLLVYRAMPCCPRGHRVLLLLASTVMT